MSVDSLGLTLGKGDSITFWASRTDESACLVIKSDGTHCEIGMDREHVEALRDQLPDVLAGLDQWVAEQEACDKAGITEKRAVDAAAQALDVAVAAEQAGAHDLAASLREAAAEASATAHAVDATVRAFEAATADADHAASKLVHLTGEVDVQFTISCEHDEFEVLFPPPMLRRFVDLATGLLAQADARGTDRPEVPT